MQGNDLGNVSVARDVVVWEGLLGVFPDYSTAAKFERYRRRGKWAKALTCFNTNQLLAAQLTRLYWNQNVEFDIITYLGDEFAEVLEKRIDREDLPVSNVFYENPQIFARSLAYQPRIRTVWDPYEEHQFLFGGKGRYLSPDRATELGAV